MLPFRLNAAQHGRVLDAVRAAAEFGISEDAAAKAYFLASCFTQQIRPAQIEGLRGNDNCPCVSGRRYDACHGS